MHYDRGPIVNVAGASARQGAIAKTGTDSSQNHMLLWDRGGAISAKLSATALFPCCTSKPSSGLRASNSSNAAAIDECVLLLRPTPCNWTRNPKFGQVFITLFFFHESFFLASSELCTVPEEKKAGEFECRTPRPLPVAPSPRATKVHQTVRF